MTRPDDRQPPAELDTAEAAEGAVTPPVRPSGGSPSLAELPLAGLTRRRVALAIGAVLAAWVIVLFARQVGDASAASARAEAMAEANGALEANVTALEQELALIQRQAYIEQQARTYRLGSPREIPFTLADNAPNLPADAPGSAGVRLGATAERPDPLGSWIRLLFGPGGDPSSLPGAGG